MDHISFSFPLLFLYAETHFRFFRLMPSLLFRRTPEMLFDMPRRIAPGQEIPVMLIINEIDTYPVEIRDVTITVSQNGTSRVAFQTDRCGDFAVTHPFEKHARVYLFVVPRDGLVPGEFFVNAKATVTQGKKRLIVINDNLVFSSKLSFKSYLAQSPLPGQEFCVFGDLHVHSQYSQSHVEFGPPVTVIDRMAAAYGIQLLGLTDHSYDLTCEIDNYLKIDPARRRWKLFRSQFENSSAFKTLIIPGEELSVRNAAGQVVHLGGLGLTDYLPGSRDGARRNRSKEKELTIPQAVSEVHRQDGLAFAAHPGSVSTSLPKVLLGRGTWELKDIAPDLDAFQAVNNGFKSTWYRARKLWIDRLLAGQKLPLIAGNDTHGDFNRYRAIAMPFLSIHEDTERYLSFVRTGIYNCDLNQRAILGKIRNGETFITSGPFLSITSGASGKDTIVSHGEISLRDVKPLILGLSTAECGAVRLLRVFVGSPAARQERMVLLKSYQGTNYAVCEELPNLAGEERGYLRAELECEKDRGERTFAATSPCYFVQ
jgi:hypothetical protein